MLPAFVDLHCHWRTPGFEYKEDVETGSRAAAAGGYTFVNLMPNTNARLFLRPRRPCRWSRRPPKWVCVT